MISIKNSRQNLMEHSLFLKAEINAIEKSKFIESQKAKRDLFFDPQGKPSQDFFIWWISNHGRNFREAWKKSLCLYCEKIPQCKDCLKNICEKFIQNPDLKPNIYKKLKLFLYWIIFKMDYQYNLRLQRRSSSDVFR
jgi:hypothetical protein